MLKILYIGGFTLPDNNAAAHRVINNGKALRDIGYEVIYLNSLVKTTLNNIIDKDYFGFKCFEYKRENLFFYLFDCKIVKNMIEKISADIVIAYNYPSIALNKIRRYCNKKNIICISDCTEWYHPEGNIVHKLIKFFDTEYRMRYVHKKMNGVITISKYLDEYYKKNVKTVMVPPLIDIKDDKWRKILMKENDPIVFLYAGSPSVTKERLDLIIEQFNKYNGSNHIILKIVGISKQDYIRIYKKKCIDNNVVFYGRLDNVTTVNMIKQADWTITLREKRRVVEAGFPTKVAESITCSTPVIINEFSNICDYLNDSNSLIIKDLYDFDQKIIDTAIEKICVVDNKTFHYQNYLNEFTEFMSTL